jgi:dihydroneopterin aldolase
MGRTMDFIFIRALRIEALIGFHKRELVVPQTVQVDLEIGIANTRVFESDKVADCIDYDRVATRVRELAAKQRYNLVETLADRIARMVLEEFGAARVRVSAAKLGILKNAGLVGVTIERSR